ncbi:NAD(P)/FAD-dependent oxidoreductase [Clostridium culturomicium]|uniref:NAD(P)/FAD-dependent oxidoreductase n=1 Tax=Clostridium culturomicium TaxID=1499683 RepID=UPI0006940718|nr:NAD(P)/FAD-dependent oxidoreductase [Clostridium culturomicium]
MKKYDLIVIGAGISGLSSAIEAKSRGVEKILLIDRDTEPGGAMNSCVHTGFYYKNIKENLSSPELISKLIEEVQELGIEILCETTAIELKKDKNIVFVNKKQGIKSVEAKAIILATGSREKPYGYKNVLGYGAMSGITTAGTTLKCINRKGVLPGKHCIILGSDDIGVLTARTLVQEGANVKCMIETSSNIRVNNEASRDFIEDFNIPILFNHRVVKIYGTARVTGVDIVKLDEDYHEIDGTLTYMECDTLVLCMKPRPDIKLLEGTNIELNDEDDGALVNEKMETTMIGVFACGTVIDGYNSVENVMRQGRRAGISASDYIFSIK